MLNKYGMSYTKKNLNIVTLLCITIIFIFLYLIYNNIFKSITKASYQKLNVIYSKTIPIQTSNKIISNLKQTKNNENLLTQRQVTKINKTNPWRIQIPKLSINIHIEEGTTDKVLLKAVGHFGETSKWNGNVGLAGHNRGYKCNFFEKIKNLKIGDEIIYSTKQGKRVYKVQSNKVILETDWSYLQETKDNRITLITCEENRGEYRRCVQAMQVLEYL